MANVGQAVGPAIEHVRHGAQLDMARRAYRLDARTLRIDLLNAVKEDIRDHHSAHAGRIDTLLLVQTLLLTYALGTLQCSSQYVPQTADLCPNCFEVRYPTLIHVYVYLVAAILILPFWCILMLLSCKLKLDRWLEVSVRVLNCELRETLESDVIWDARQKAGKMPASTMEGAANVQLEGVEESIVRMGGYVADYQDSFTKAWSGECETMVRGAAILLWACVVVAVSITSGLFFMFLRNNLATHPNSAQSFMILVVLGLIAPVGYYLTRNFEIRWGTRDVFADEGFADGDVVGGNSDFLQVDGASLQKKGRGLGGWRMSTRSSALASAVLRPQASSVGVA